MYYKYLKLINCNYQLHFSFLFIYSYKKYKKFNQEGFLLEILLDACTFLLLFIKTLSKNYTNDLKFFWKNLDLILSIYIYVAYFLVGKILTFRNSTTFELFNNFCKFTII